MLALVTATTLSRPDEDEPLLLAALRARGVDVHMAAWDDPDVDWHEYDAAVVRSTWNYVHARDRFVAWAHATAKVTRLANPASVLEWNSEKSYLLRYAARGIATVPTVIVPRGSTPLLRELVDWPEVVIKPRVSAGSFETYRVDRADRDGRLAVCAAERDVLVQPYIRSVESHGERSLVFLAGTLTHAIRKSPRFDSDDESVRSVPIEDDERRFAAEVLANVDEPLLYARVDLARAEDGTPLLMELELVEPSLFLRHDAVALEHFAGLLEKA
ncbi:MAG: hypothetical protein ABI321_11975 [Polyangia bacterium]